MATSGTTAFSQTRNEAIRDAFQILNVYGIGKTLASEDLTFASSLLNKMLKAWQAKGLHLWTKTEGVLFLTQYQNSYLLGSTAKAAKASDVIITQLNGAVAASGTTITVDSTAGMVAGDNIGVVLTSKAISWTTINTVSSSTSLILTAGISTAASDNAIVYTYTTAIEKPLRVFDPRAVNGIDSGSTSTLVEVPITMIAYADYINMPVKTQNNGTPIEAVYNPTNTSGTLNLFPRPNDCSYRVHFTYERKIEDMTTTSDDFDLPSEWLEAVTYQLACRLARPYGKAAALQDLLPMASQMLSDLLDWDSEKEYIEVSPECN